MRVARRNCSGAQQGWKYGGKVRFRFAVQYSGGNEAVIWAIYSTKRNFRRSAQVIFLQWVTNVLFRKDNFFCATKRQQAGGYTADRNSESDPRSSAFICGFSLFSGRKGRRCNSCTLARNTFVCQNPQLKRWPAVTFFLWVKTGATNATSEKQWAVGSGQWASEPYFRIAIPRRLPGNRKSPILCLQGQNRPNG